MGTAERPSVHVSGFPVLTQLAGGTLRHIDLTAHDIPADDAPARRVEATAFLSYEGVSAALGVAVSQGDEPGRINATATLPLVGDVTVSAAVSAASGNRIAFADLRAVHGELIPPLKALLDRALDEPIPLRNLPEGLRLKSVATSGTGIDAVFAGRSVAFRPSSSAAG